MKQLVIPGVSRDVIKESIDNLRNNILDDKSNQEILVAIKHTQLRVLNPLAFLIDEICDCLLTNKFVAATTTTNLLFENMLKLSLIIHDSNGKTIDDDGINFEDMYEEEVEANIEKLLNDNINRAFKVGLIDEEEKDELHKLRKKFRNSFSHGSFNDAIKSATNVIYCADISNPTNIQERVVPVTGQPFLYYMAQHEFLRREAMEYFQSVYIYIDSLDKKLLQIYE